MCVLAFQADRGCGVDDHTRVATMTLRLGPKVTGALERNLDPVDRPWQPIMRRRKFLRFRHLGMSLLLIRSSEVTMPRSRAVLWIAWHCWNGCPSRQRNVEAPFTLNSAGS